MEDRALKVKSLKADYKEKSGIGIIIWIQFSHFSSVIKLEKISQKIHKISHIVKEKKSYEAVSIPQFPIPLPIHCLNVF